MYYCIIVDDESHGIEGLTRYIDKIPELSLKVSYMDPIQALVEISCIDHVDLILMDIDMPELSGIELSMALRKKTHKLVFTTAHSKYAYEAFRADADDYLLKPYTFGQFLITFNKLFPKKESVVVLPSIDIRREGFFFIKSKEETRKLVKLWFDDVISIESKSNYILVTTKDKNITSYMSLTEVAEKLSDLANFLKFQRSFIVNKIHIDSIQGNTIHMDNGNKIIVGDYYKNEFNEFVNRNLIKGRRGM